MERYLMISDAAKEVQVESHVLRYWEEELHLPIRRNELGHRYYTEGDVELFKQIKSMKEGGLQLKAIKMILKDGKIDVMLPENESVLAEEQMEEDVLLTDNMPIRIISSRDTLPEASKEGEAQMSDAELRGEKARRLQWLLQQLIRETLQENNQELCRVIKEGVVKELDYQFRVREEKEEERDRIREQREEEHYQKLDALLRKKVKAGKKTRETLDAETKGEQKHIWQNDVQANHTPKMTERQKHTQEKEEEKQEKALWNAQRTAPDAQGTMSADQRTAPIDQRTELADQGTASADQRTTPTDPKSTKVNPKKRSRSGRKKFGFF